MIPLKLPCNCCGIYCEYGLWNKTGCDRASVHIWSGLPGRVKVVIVFSLSFTNSVAGWSLLTRPLLPTRNRHNRESFRAMFWCCVSNQVTLRVNPFNWGLWWIILFLQFAFALLIIFWQIFKCNAFKYLRFIYKSLIWIGFTVIVFDLFETTSYFWFL